MDIFAANCRKNSGKFLGNYKIVSSAHYFHALVMLLISEVYSENFESHPDHWDGNIYNLEYCLELAILHFIISWSFHFFVPQGDGIWLLQSKERERWRNVENDEWREVAENAACVASPGIWLSVLCFAISVILVSCCGSLCKCFVHLGWCTVGVWLFSTRPQQRGYQL